MRTSMIRSRILTDCCPTGIPPPTLFLRQKMYALGRGLGGGQFSNNFRPPAIHQTSWAHSVSTLTVQQRCTCSVIPGALFADPLPDAENLIVGTEYGASFAKF